MLIFQDFEFQFFFMFGPKFRVPDIWRCAIGGFRHTESESEVKNLKFRQLEAKTWNKLSSSTSTIEVFIKFKDSRHAQLPKYGVFHQESNFQVKKQQF